MCIHAFVMHSITVPFTYRIFKCLFVLYMYLFVFCIHRALPRWSWRQPRAGQVKVCLNQCLLLVSQCTLCIVIYPIAPSSRGQPPPCRGHMQSGGGLTVSVLCASCVCSLLCSCTCSTCTHSLVVAVLSQCRATSHPLSLSLSLSLSPSTDVLEREAG